MNLRNIYLGFTLILVQFLTHIFTSIHGNGNTSYVQDACSVTMYPDICIHSLGSYSDRAKHNNTLWARAAVSVSIDRAKNVSRYLKKLETNSMRGRNKAALLDCIDCFEDLLHHLHKSLWVLRRLNGQEFFDQIDDVTTWVSTALTDEDTCLDGFGDRIIGNRINFLCHKVMNLSYITSNALALVNNLAISGLLSLSP